MKIKENYSLFMFGCSHNSAPLHIRESFSISSISESTLYNNLLQNKNILELFILNTCNRIEIYIVSTPSINKDPIIEAYCHTQKISKDECMPYFSLIYDESVIEHLFQVTSGIDSQLIGETEILGQVKLAYQKAQKTGATGKILNRILQKSFQVAKWARTNTGISKGQTSIGSIACDLALRIFGNLNTTRILVIGSGEIGEKAILALKLRGAKDLTVTNRTFHKACDLAEQIGATVIPYELFPEKIHLFNIIICSTAAPNVILCSEMAKTAMKIRPELPLFLIDLSLPRNICPHTAEISNIYLYNIEDLAKMANENLKSRQNEVDICRKNLTAKAQQVWSDLKQPYDNRKPTFVNAN